MRVCPHRLSADATRFYDGSTYCVVRISILTALRFFADSFFFSSPSSLSPPTKMTEFDSNTQNPPLAGDASRKMEPLGASAKELFAAPTISDVATGFYELFPSMPTPTLFREMISEFFGVFLIVQMGTGTVCSAIFSGDIYGGAQTGVWQIAVVWGIAVVIAVGMAGPVSGAHLNPAMTIALSIFRKFPKSKILWYIEAQLLGAMAAAFVNLRLFAHVIRKYETLHGFQRGSDQSFLSARAFGEYPTIGQGRDHHM